jgi:hypothetical protein
VEHGPNDDAPQTIAIAYAVEVAGALADAQRIVDEQPVTGTQASRRQDLLKIT